MEPVKSTRFGSARLSTLGALAACLYALLLGISVIPLAGIEGDEALFASPLFRPVAADAFLNIVSVRIPLMLISYLGCLKTWIYWAIFHVFGTSIFALRFPMALAGAGSVWLFFLLMRRVAGNRAALIAAGILAADATFVITNCFDWGPVALQHLLFAGGFLLLIRFYQEGGDRWLFAGCVLLGLVLWDKALATWMLSGLGIGLVAVFPRQILAMVSKRRLATAAAGFLLGALPLVIYNAEHGAATFRGNFTRDTQGIAAKWRSLVYTARGDGIYGFLFEESWKTPKPHQAQGPMQRASEQVADMAGHPTHHLLPYAFVLALLLTPLARGYAWRAILAATIALAVAWLEMAITANAGGSVHHTLLLWPLPQAIIGISFAAASRRLGRFGIPVVATVALTVVVSATLVGNEYYYLGWRNGGKPGWSDGILALAEEIKKVPASTVYCVDWGIQEPLRLLDAGSLPLSESGPVPGPSYTVEQGEALRALIADPQGVFIAHTAAFEEFAGANKRFVDFAAKAGYERQMVMVTSNSFGREEFEVYRFGRVER